METSLTSGVSATGGDGVLTEASGKPNFYSSWLADVQRRDMPVFDLMWLVSLVMETCSVLSLNCSLCILISLCFHFTLKLYSAENLEEDQRDMGSSFILFNDHFSSFLPSSAIQHKSPS